MAIFIIHLKPQESLVAREWLPNLERAGDRNAFLREYERLINQTSRRAPVQRAGAARDCIGQGVMM
jgi:hypothetical protein